jgi:predicted esterase
VGSVVTVLSGQGGKPLPKAEAFAVETKALGSIPVWIFHGAKDHLVPIAMAREAAKTFQDAGVTIRYTEYPDGDHDVRDQAFRTPGFWNWLFAQHR